MTPFVTTAHAAEGISIHLSPYIVGEVFGVPITATLLTVWLTMALLIVVGVLIKRNLALVPGKLQSTFELLISSVYDYMSDVLESKQLAKRYFPIVMTIFLFVLAMNWIGLLPGVTSIGYYAGHGSDSHFIPFLYPPGTDLNITVAFALIAFVTIEIAGVSVLGIYKYAGKFINLSMFRKFNTQNIIGFFLGIIELISEIARLIAFSFRLFGNIFAGKTLLVVAMFFVPYILPVPLLAFEVFVGFIQAFIFAILTLFFIKIAITEPH